MIQASAGALIFEGRPYFFRVEDIKNADIPILTKSELLATIDQAIKNELPGFDASSSGTRKQLQTLRNTIANVESETLVAGALDDLARERDLGRPVPLCWTSPDSRRSGRHGHRWWSFCVSGIATNRPRRASTANRAIWSENWRRGWRCNFGRRTWGGDGTSCARRRATFRVPWRLV